MDAVLIRQGARWASTKPRARSARPCCRIDRPPPSGALYFVTKKTLRVCCERSITTLPRLFINAGKRGLLCTMTPAELVRVLSPTLVDCQTGA